MAHFSDGPTISMPDFSVPSSSAGDMRFHLQNLLDSKEKQLQQAGTLGQRVLAQQMELEERIRQLQETDADKGEDDELDAEATERYRELAETIRTWDAENAQLSSAFGSKRSKEQSPSLALVDLPREEPERSKAAGSSAAQSRRAKNAAHRADDVEFAFEIGSGLLTEVRRLQSLLAERDKAIQDMKEEKDDLEKSVESLRTALRQQEQSADKFKEENWNLEVTLQELRVQLTDSQSTTQRLEGEQKRLTKQLNSSREAADSNKTESDRLKNELDGLKAKHETDVAQARKTAASLQRDKSDLQSNLDRIKAEVARAGRRITVFGSPLTPGGTNAKDYLTPADRDEDDVFSTTTGGLSTNRRKLDGSALFPADGFGDDLDSSPEPSPSRPFITASHPSNEIEALQQRLAHAQRQINTLKGTLRREKELRMDYRRKLESSPGFKPEDLPEDDLDDYEDIEDVDDEQPKPQRKITPFRATNGRGRGGRGRARGRGGLSLIQRMSLAANSPSSTYDDEDLTELATPPPPVPSIPDRFQDETEDDITPQAEQSPEDEQEQDSPSNQVSVEGMDPAFANVLRKPSMPSPHGSSPLRQSVTARSVRGGGPRKSRGGAAYQEPRPSSLVGQPEALADELGLGMASAEAEHLHLHDKKPPVETAEFGCQTDFVETPVPVPEPVPEPVAAPLPIHVTPAMTDMAVQVDPVPEPTVTTSETSSQTDEQPSPVLVSASMNTEPEARPLTPRLVEFQVQTPISAMFDDEDPARRTTVTQFDWARSSIGSTVPGDATVTKSTRRFLADHELDEGTEPGTGTDTDGEGYVDAPQSVMGTTPSASQDDFGSLMTMSDNDFSSEDDDDSLKASRLARPLRSTNSLAGRSVSSQHAPSVPYDLKDVTAETIQPPPRIVHVPAPKPEVKETAVQTDEWTPPAPVPASAPVSPGGFGLYRVGSTGKQFQFVSSPTSAGPTSNVLPLSPSPMTIQDSSGTFGTITRTRTSHSDRKQSIDSAISSMDEPPRPRVPSGTPTIDKSRPPMMAVPPPPRQPPPPNSMLPPAFIPERRDVPPPRPSSPPPADLIQRAATPLGSVLSVPGGRPSHNGRQHGSSMPPSQTGLRQLPSTSSFRSAANAAAYAQQALSQSDRSLASPRSSMSSDHGIFTNRPQANSIAPVTPARDSAANRSGLGGSTDPTIIHAITQTMIGEFLYKYTRRTIGKGHGDRRHKRFFWVHPYTKTLYWSSADPGSSNVSESSAKSAYIEGVRSVLDPNPMPPGLYQYSVIISTAQREMKITAPTKERHDIWLNALKYLLSRPNAIPVASPGNETVMPASPMSIAELGTTVRPPITPSPQSQRSVRSARNDQTWSTTPRGQRSRSQLSVVGSVGKRSGTPAAEYLRWNGPDSPYSPTKSFEHVRAVPDEDDLDFELHGEARYNDGFEGLENVRACCDGRHTVGHHHHHHYHTLDQAHNGDAHLDVHASDSNRPVSPAWSLRSRTGSNTSHEGNGMFGGKLRFGSRRSTKTPSAITGAHDQ